MVRGSTREKLRRAIEFAILAPSGHNTQPWLFRILGEHVDLLADRRRGLPVVDPHDRELTISCGAALFQLLLALRRFGARPHLSLTPDPHEEDLLARVGVVGSHAASADEIQLFEAIPRRHTNRQPFENRPVDGATVDTLVRDAEREGAWVTVLAEPGQKEAVADLIAQGDHLQASDKSFRRELASWVHSNRSKSRDGMPGYAHGIGNVASYFGRLIIRNFDFGGGQAAKDRQLAQGSSVLLVLGAERDTTRGWLEAGQALAALLLRATALGLSASYLNQPVEVESLRPRLAEVVGGRPYPQLIIRLGYGPDVRGTPRRPVEDVLIRET